MFNTMFMKFFCILPSKLIKQDSSELTIKDDIAFQKCYNIYIFFLKHSQCQKY